MSADYVIGEVLLGQCWARSADGSAIAVDLVPLIRRRDDLTSDARETLAGGAGRRSRTLEA